MPTTLLDAGLSGSGDAWGTLFLIFAAVVLIEAVVMLLFRLKTFGKCLLDSFIVNLASVVVGIILSFLEINVSIINNPSNVTVILLALLATVIVEGLILMLLNNKTAAGKVWLVTVVMNIVSYTALILLVNALVVSQ
jgi:hypothetical protein